MTGRLGAILTTALLAPAIAAVAAVVSAQEGGAPTDVRGEVLQCPGGGQVQQRFFMEGDNWEITGNMTAGPEVSITVAGPSGDVTVVPTVNLEVGPGVQVGQPVTMRGTTVAVTGEMVATSLVDACAGGAAQPSPEATQGADEAAAAVGDGEEDGDALEARECNRGPGNSGELRARIKNGRVHIKRGAVASFDGSTLVVETPSGAVSLLIDGETKLRGDPGSAAEVRVRGELEGDEFVADEVRVLCTDTGGLEAGGDLEGDAEHEDHEADEDADDEDEDGDEDDDSGDKGEGSDD